VPGAASLAAVVYTLISIQDVAWADDRPIVWYASMDHVSPVSAVAGATAAPKLPASLVIPPGRYSFSGVAYDLRKPGLYRFMCPFKDNQQRIVYDEHKGNIDTLVSGLAWCVTHGNSDNDKSGDALTRKATTAKLFITCNNSAQWAIHVLSPYRIRVRPADSLTLDEWNSYDNGHSMIEIYREDLNKWVLYDFDANVCFLHKGTLLSLAEMIEHAASGDYEFKPFAADTGMDISNFKSPRNGFDWGFSAEITRTNDGARWWYKRVLQVPLLGNCFYLPSPNDADRARVAHYSGQNYTCLTKEEFLKKFY
jgi:hypothetical protein